MPETLNAVNFARSKSGMPPLKRLSSATNATSLLSSLRPAGSSPANPFLETSRARRFLSRESEAGRTPESRLPRTESLASPAQPAMLAGNMLRRPFPRRLSSRSSGAAAHSVDGAVEVEESPEVAEDDSVDLQGTVAYHTAPRRAVDAARVGGRVPPEGPRRLVAVAPRESVQEPDEGCPNARRLPVCLRATALTGAACRYRQRDQNCKERCLRHE